MSVPSDIRHSVGQRGENRPADVRVIQSVLTELATAFGDDALHPGPVDGLCGDGTIGSIEHFQRLNGTRADGRIDAGGFTQKALPRWLCIATSAEPANHHGWRFPLNRIPSSPFQGPGSGMRAFGWRRSGGTRRHAGVDLYAPVGTPVLAVSDGVVKRVAPFYLKTDAVEVEHDCGCVVRYGEVKPLVREDETVKRGQQIATVAQMYTRSGPFHLVMLHVELYSGLRRGGLTQPAGRSAIHGPSGKPFMRRRDLMDPTALLARAPLS